MALFQINSDLTYVKSPLVDKNVFLNMPADTSELPKYDEIAHLLPKPVWDGRDDAIESVALNMIQDGEPLDKIIKFTKLSVERIKELADKLKN